jgi:ADP-glucose pyrophosphorylase
VSAKPGVPIDSKGRLIEVPISNSTHSGIDRVSFLMKHLSASFHRYVQGTKNIANWIPGLKADEPANSDSDSIG